MFTGIVEEMAEVLERTPGRLRLTRPKRFADLTIGSSVAVSGVCLTVARLTKKSIPLCSASHFALPPSLFERRRTGLASRDKSRSCAGQVAAMMFDVVPETWKRTTLGVLNVGESVNLERALKVGGRLEGHMVQGHVDGVGKVVRFEKSPRKPKKPKSPGNMRAAHPSAGALLAIRYPSSLRGLIVEKGSIAVDGVSLTVAHVSEDAFTVALIPHTRTHTTLGSLKEGDQVNLEGDVLGKYLRAIIAR